MCGRYALSIRPSSVRQRFEEHDMPVEDAPTDDDERLRQTYNFAPGYYGLIYRAELPHRIERSDEVSAPDVELDEPSQEEGTSSPNLFASEVPRRDPGGCGVKYIFQAAKWGLVPFWTKRSPDFASQLRTINCRDDSLAENRGMWNTMKQQKRCVVVAEGFFEWLKKNDGKEKLPHYVKRKDGQLMCFAGLWDKVKYENAQDELYTYTIITTDANKQLRFLHDRMPVILDTGSDAMATWLNPRNSSWSRHLQKILKPYGKDLVCYQVDRSVGKVGNNSPSFVVPIDSKDNRSNILNFFANQEQKNSDKADDLRITTNKSESTEDNAPMPVSQHWTPSCSEPDNAKNPEGLKPSRRSNKRSREVSEVGDVAQKKVAGGRDNLRSANRTLDTAKSPRKETTAKITSFFGRDDRAQ